MLEGGKELRSGDARECPECLTDDTVLSDAKLKLLENRSKLQLYLESKFHAPYQRQIRKTRIAMSQHASKKAACKSCGKTYTRYEDLVNHLHQLIEQDIDETDPHYATLVADGWFSPTFNESRRAKSAHDKELRRPDDIVSDRKPNTAVPLTEPRLARFEGKEVPGVFVGPIPRPSLNYPDHLKDWPRVTPQSLREQMDALGAAAPVQFVEMPRDGGTHFKKDLERRGLAHLFEWGIPRVGEDQDNRGESKGKGKGKGKDKGKQVAGLGEPTVRQW